MATCKECIHSECCFMQYGKTNALKWQSELGCKNFKDRSRLVELPFEFISKKDLIRELSAQCAVNKIDLETAHDMIKHLPYFRTEAERIDVARDNLAEAVRAVSAAAKYRIKQKPKPDLVYCGYGKCPECGTVFIGKLINYCGNCGQALDWS